MIVDYKRVSQTEWQWEQGAKTYAVRYFPRTGRLIWSGWVPTGDSSMFDEGVAQDAVDFLERGAAQHTPPPALLDELREVLLAAQAENKPRGCLDWLRKI